LKPIVLFSLFSSFYIFIYEASIYCRSSAKNIFLSYKFLLTLHSSKRVQVMRKGGKILI
jgi:hypothetical protein